MALVFILMEFPKGSDRIQREIPLPQLALERAQKLFGLASSELMYECIAVSDTVASELQSLSPASLDTSSNDYFLERREEEVKA